MCVALLQTTIIHKKAWCRDTSVRESHLKSKVIISGKELAGQSLLSQANPKALTLRIWKQTCMKAILSEDVSAL